MDVASAGRIRRAGANGPAQGLPAPETGAPSGRADAHPDFGRSSALLARVPLVDSSGSGKPERGVSPRGPSHAPNAAIAHSSIAIDPVAAHRALKIATHFPAFAVMARPSDRGRIPLRRDPSASNPRKKLSFNLSNNPVNLSNFIEIYGNSISPGEATGFAIIRARAPGSATAIAGKCGLVSNGMQRISPGRREGAMSAQPQMRGNAPRGETSLSGDKGNPPTPP